MKPSVFTKIIRGEIPAARVYEDEKTLAFMSIDPYIPGHVLVVPKLQVDNFEDLPPADYQAVFLTVQKVARRIKAVLGVPKAVVMVMGFEVPHTHVHVIPSTDGHDFARAVGVRADPDFKPPAPDYPGLKTMAEKLAFE